MFTDKKCFQMHSDGQIRQTLLRLLTKDKVANASRESRHRGFRHRLRNFDKKNHMKVDCRIGIVRNQNLAGLVARRLLLRCVSSMHSEALHVKSMRSLQYSLQMDASPGRTDRFRIHMRATEILHSDVPVAPQLSNEKVLQSNPGEVCLSQSSPCSIRARPTARTPHLKNDEIVTKHERHDIGHRLIVRRQPIAALRTRTRSDRKDSCEQSGTRGLQPLAQ